MLLILIIVTWYEEESQQYWTYVVNMLLCGIIMNVYQYIQKGNEILCLGSMNKINQTNYDSNFFLQVCVFIYVNSKQCFSLHHCRPQLYRSNNSRHYFQRFGCSF